MVMTPVKNVQSLILWLDQIRLDDLPQVGGKNASLGEMIQQLTPQGIAVPGGFATTAQAYRHFIDSNGLRSGPAIALPRSGCH
jgi:pyruvate,water dikinase